MCDQINLHDLLSGAWRREGGGGGEKEKERERGRKKANMKVRNVLPVQIKVPNTDSQVKPARLDR